MSAYQDSGVLELDEHVIMQLEALHKSLDSPDEKNLFWSAVRNLYDIEEFCHQLSVVYFPPPDKDPKGE